MSPDGKGTYVLSAGSVCFPLRWELTEKFGLPMAGIHHAVPGYDEKLAAPSDRYMVGLKAHKPSWRSNWSIVDAPDLYLKQRRFAQGQNSEITAENAGRKLWIDRSGRACEGCPAPATCCSRFGLTSGRCRCWRACRRWREGLAQALDKVPPEMRGYKNQLPIREALLAYLSPYQRLSPPTRFAASLQFGGLGGTALGGVASACLARAPAARPSHQ